MGDDLSGTVLDDRYQVIAPIADGAMGSVYRGERLKLGRAVAIKIMHDALPDEMASRQRFDREAKLMARLEHPNCVSVMDFGVYDGKPYLVMELVRGTSLLQVIEKEGRIDPLRSAAIIRQVLSGLAHAHELGIVHRDIKPANIMISEAAGIGEQVRILDFGLARGIQNTDAKLTMGIVVGTPNYMAPEQCKGGELDARTDLYACGVVLFEMLTGKKPFTADDPIGVVRKHMNQPAPKLADIAPGDYGELQAIVSRALEKEPAKRFASAAEMKKVIDTAIERRGGRATSSGVQEATASGWQMPVEIGSSAIVAVSDAPAPPPPPPEMIGSSAIVAVEDESIGTQLAAIRASAPPPPPREPRYPTGPSMSRASTPPAAEDPHERSILMRMLPRSRMKWAALALATLVVIGMWAIVAGKKKLAETSQTDQADIEIDKPDADRAKQLVSDINQLIASDDTRAALDLALKARKQYPQSAQLAFVAGKLYFGKLYWTDGIKQFRDAIRLDGSYQSDPELIKITLKGFITTPGMDDRIEAFLRDDIGKAAVPYLEETAHDHPNPAIRARASAMLRRMP